MAQPKAKAKPAAAGTGKLAAKRHKGNQSQLRSSQPPASDADTKAIQKLLARCDIDLRCAAASAAKAVTDGRARRLQAEAEAQGAACHRCRARCETAEKKGRS